ncbi:MAG: alpha/beta fold hydrolase [Planctomycetota bacterium]
MFTNLKIFFLILAAVVQCGKLNGQEIEKTQVNFDTADGITISGDLFICSKDAPTVVCLHMYRSNRDAWEPLTQKLTAAEINVLNIDMRGHGDSAPDLTDRVESRDETIFRDMWQDVDAAIDFLEGEGLDATRIGLCGASVGCSIAIETAVRRKGSIRAVCLLTPGSNYLGVDSIAAIEKWPGVDVHIVCSREEQDVSQAVADELEKINCLSALQLVEEEGTHGTRAFGKVADIEEQICSYFVSKLNPAVLKIPAFSENDERTSRGGFFFDTTRVQRKAGDDKFVLMTFGVGETVTIGALVYQEFDGKVTCNIGEREITVDFDTSSEERMLPAMIDGLESELEGAAGRVNQIVWFTLELEREDWFPDADTPVSLTFESSKAEQAAAWKLAIPSNGSFNADFFDVPAQNGN